MLPLIVTESPPTVEPDDELTFLHRLPVEVLWGVGKVTADKLHQRGIRTVGQVARLGEAALVSMLGQGSGRHLHALAHNRDPRPVVVGRRRGSMGAQRALGRGPHSAEFLNAALAGLVERVTRRMRNAEAPGRTVVLRLRFADYTRATRSCSSGGDISWWKANRLQLSGCPGSLRRKRVGSVNIVLHFSWIVSGGSERLIALPYDFDIFRPSSPGTLALGVKSACGSGKTGE